VDVLYSQCWEDYRLVTEALRPRRDTNVLSIGSGGENSFALLLHNPRRLTVLDMNPAQLSVIKIKAAGIEALTFEDFAQYAGFSPSSRRPQLHKHVERYLGDEEKMFVQHHPDILRSGIAHIGRFEKYLQKFRTLILPLVLSKKSVEEYLSLDSLDEQMDFYRTRWDTRRWRALFSFFFSERTMSLLGRKKEYFAYNGIADVSGHYASRAQHGITEIPAHTNPYMHQILTGTIPVPFAGHPYLDERNFDALKGLLPKMEYVCDDICSYVRSQTEPFDACNLSDVFEPLSQDVYESVLGALAQGMTPNGVVCYWNNLVNRSSHPSVNTMVKDDPLSRALTLEDRVFFYSRFLVERVNT